MKLDKTIFTLVLAMAIISFACGNKATNHSADHEVSEIHGPGSEYTSTYVCPMHCEGSGSEEAGTCPVCGMEYVLHDEHTKDGHNHK